MNKVNPSSQDRLSTILPLRTHQLRVSQCILITGKAVPAQYHIDIFLKPKQVEYTDAELLDPFIRCT